MGNIADFLKKYEKDKNYFSDFKDEDFTHYHEFFNTKLSSFLHVIDNEIFERFGKKVTYFPGILADVRNRIVE